MKVCIGGTFDQLHKGHKKLITKAFKIAGKNGFVYIGLTANKIDKRKKIITTIEERKQKLKDFLSEKFLLDRALIKPIYDKYGPSIEDDFDVIVVSPETYEIAQEINLKRIKKGKKPLKIIKINFVLAKDGKPISSTRIFKREIDKNGHILKDD